MKRLMLMILCLSFGAVTMAQSSTLRPNRFFIELGLLSASNSFYHYPDENDYSYDGHGGYGIGYPTGLSLAAVVGNQKYQLKARFLGSSDDISKASWIEFGLLGGISQYYHHIILGVNVGLSYQSSNYHYVDPNAGPPTYFKDKTYNTIGLSTEADVAFVTPYGGIAPFFFAGLNTRSYNVGIGIKLLLGKTGYTKRQLKRLRIKI